MMKRDLKADLEMCNKATPGPWVKDERGGCVAVYPSSIGEINCMGESEGKRIFYKGGYQVLDEDGRFKHWEVHPQDIADAEFVAQAREGWPHAIERAIKAEEVVQDLARVLRLYEKWEADLRMDNSLWQSASGLPFITQEVWDELVAVQTERNKVLHKAKEVLGDD